MNETAGSVTWKNWKNFEYLAAPPSALYRANIFETLRSAGQYNKDDDDRQ